MQPPRLAKDMTLTSRLGRLPLFLLIFGATAASMLVPAGYGLIANNHEAARAFLYAGVLGLVTFTLVGIAHADRSPRQAALGPLMSLFCAFVLLPFYLALPFIESLPTTRLVNVYFEMVSAFTTTGATMYPDPARLNPTLHLWRAQVGWMGGLLMLVAASAILAPLHLGGFEVTAQAEPGRRDTSQARITPPDPRRRLFRVLRTLFPIYAGLTLLLWLLLLANGQRPVVALCHAMSVMATSGISPVGGVHSAGIGVPGEAVMMLFMMFALSRLTFSKDTATATQGGRLSSDPEFRIGLFIVIGVPLVLFARHFIGAYDVAAMENFAQAGHALWGAIFTVMSFLTTTGFVSEHWAQAQDWSGLPTPGLILMGLALIGGGVATTAGGVKLLRVFALYQNGAREMERLVHPHSVSGAGAAGRRLQSNGAFIAWIFFMLFALSLAGVTLLLTLTGMRFENAMVMSIASLSTTGPLSEFATGTPIRLIELTIWAKAILCGAMVLGRLETLAIIALLTPDLWRS